jgi:hypothetical protein
MVPRKIIKDERVYFDCLPKEIDVRLRSGENRIRDVRKHFSPSTSLGSIVTVTVIDIVIVVDMGILINTGIYHSDVPRAIP